MQKPPPTSAEAERRSEADSNLQAFCDMVVSRAATVMAEQHAPLEMVLDRMLTYTTAQCVATLGKADAQKMLRQAQRAIDRGDFNHLVKTIN